MRKEKAFPLIWYISEAAAFFAILYFSLRGIPVPWLRYGAVGLAAVVSIILFAVRRDRERLFLMLAMIFTMAADWFLVVREDRFEIAVAIFIIAQIMHYVRLLMADRKAFRSIVIRIAGSGVLAALFHKDLLLTLASCYILELLLNAADSVFLFKSDRNYVILFVGFLLFIFCDICVALSAEGARFGLSKAAEETVFHLIYVFYLPSQVLIVRSGFRSAGDRVTE